MKVGFLHVGPDTRLASIMVRSCLDHGYELIQMTDADSAAIDGCRVVRIPWNHTRLMTYRLKHLAELGEPDLTVLDTDTVVLRDISDIWGAEFDLALTKRGATISAQTGVDVAKDMPYNIGVMFVRDPKVWEYAHRFCASLSDKLQTWWGDQLAMAAAANEFQTLELPCSEWNYTPRSAEDVPDVRVLHYKGPRKRWMIDKWQSVPTAG